MAGAQKQAPFMTVVFVFLAMVVILLSVAAFIDVRENEQAPEEETSTSVVDESVVQDLQVAPVYFATFTHLEGGWTQALESEFFFEKQASYLRMAYDLAEHYDAVITIESEIPMARAMVKWDDNLLRPLQNSSFYDERG